MSRYPKIVYWLPALVWMAVIFSFSARPAVQASAIDWQDFLVKKSAHFVEYAILTFLVIFSLAKTTRMSRINAVMTAIFLSVAYAFSDELHQSFVPGREARIRDVVIDSLGSFSAGLFYLKNKWLDKLNYRV